jgi:hypothetical protein
MTCDEFCAHLRDQRLLRVCVDSLILFLPLILNAGADR